jgi:hypothetical protein
MVPIMIAVKANVRGRFRTVVTYVREKTAISA